MITEDQLEQLCLKWFRENGYGYVYGPDIAHDGGMPERTDYRQVVLTGRLLSAMQKINPQIPPAVLEDAAIAITKPESPVLINNNRKFHKLLLEGVPVEYSDGDDTQTDHARLIDFADVHNNQFLVVNQFTIQGTKMNRRPDVVVFINGLPIAVIELKNPSNEQTDVWDAYNQLQTYKEEISDLFVFNEALLISDGWTARVGSLTARLDTKSGKYIFGYAKYMRDAIPNASFIGFTGTPISLDDKDTRAVFGEYVSIYDIQDAVDDGATVPIYYESRLAKLDINREAIDELNKEVEDIIEDEEEISKRERTKSKWAALEKLVGAKSRLEEVAKDLVNHFETRDAVIPGKAMIVCMSREICVQLYDEITALRPQWHDPDPEKGAIKIVMTGSAADKAHIQDHVYSHLTKKRIEKRFKDADDELKMVIVRDMWLTGFDVPCCHTMYVDKPMRGHNLMQAIARVNRVFKDKPGGLVVDYIGIGNELKGALKVYTDAKGKGRPNLPAEDALGVLVEKIEVVRAMFHGFDYSDYKTNAAMILPMAANHILGLEEGKKRFLDAVTSITRAFSLCSTLDEAAQYNKEIAFFSAIKAAIIKHTTIDKKRAEEEKNSALKQILDNAVIADGVADIFELAGLDKPNISLLSDEFLEDVRRMQSKNLAVELLERLLRDAVKARTRNNVVQETKYGERLLATLRKYHNRAIETAQVIEELIQMAKDFQEAMMREEELGLSPDEIAFYNALANNESAVRELGDEILKKISQELTEKLRASTTIDWQVRDNVRAKMRNMIRRLLKKYKYPPDKQQEAIDMVLEQAERLSYAWTA